MMEITDPDYTVVADTGDLCGEGPLWDDRHSALYWTDIAGKRFYRYDLNARRHAVVSEGFEVSGCAFNRDRGFVAVNSGGFWLWDHGGAPVLLHAEAEGQRCALNDCLAGPLGEVYSGSCFYDPASGDYPLGALFRLDPGGSVRVLDTGFRLSNGLGLSPDCRTLYFSDSASRTIYSYSRDTHTGDIHGRRVFFKSTRSEGIPDGLTVDAEGFVWCALWFGEFVLRIDPDGKVERRILAPARQTSSLAFGGPELTDLFLTSAGFPDALALAPEGYDPANVYSGGRLFRLDTEIRGKIEFRCGGTAFSGTSNREGASK